MFISAYRQLTAHERQFVDAYVGYAAERAAQRNERISLATQYAPPQALVEQSRGLIERPMVQAAVHERITELARSHEITIDRWIRRVSALAHSNIRDFLVQDEDGNFSIDPDTPYEAWAAVKELIIDKSGDGMSRPMKVTYRFKMHDSISPLKMEGEYLGALAGDNPHNTAYIAQLNQYGVGKAPADAYAEMIGG